jgi:hypothetical protein
MEHFSAAHVDRIVHVHYPDLLADPVAATDAAFEALALPIPAGAPERIEAFIHRQRHGHRVAPLSSYEDYGYTFDDVWPNRPWRRTARPSTSGQNPSGW